MNRGATKNQCELFGTLEDFDILKRSSREMLIVSSGFQGGRRRGSLLRMEDAGGVRGPAARRRVRWWASHALFANSVSTAQIRLFIDTFSTIHYTNI